MCANSVEVWKKELRKTAKRLVCSCGDRLDFDALMMYPHEDGWSVLGCNERQWLYVHCHNCGYDWSVWKLGIPREVIE